jgi:hypothetical protein
MDTMVQVVTKLVTGLLKIAIVKMIAEGRDEKGKKRKANERKILDGVETIEREVGEGAMIKMNMILILMTRSPRTSLLRGEEIE